MKKFFGIVAFLLVLFIVFLIISIGFGIGKGKGFGDGNSKDEVKESQEKAETKDDSEETLVFEVSVVKSDYFYDNDRIELDDFIKIVQESDEKCIVKIKDDRASLKAYNRLTDKLEELKIEYVEK